MIHGVTMENTCGLRTIATQQFRRTEKGFVQTNQNVKAKSVCV